MNCPKSYSSQYRLNDHKKVCSGASSVLSNNTVRQTLKFHNLDVKEFFLQDPAFINEVVAYAMETTVLTAARAYKVSWTLDIKILLFFLLHSQSLILSEDWVSIVRQLLMLAIQLVLVVRYQTPRSTTGFETWKIRNLKFAHTVVKNASTKMLLGST